MSDIVKPRFEPCAICDNTGWVCEGHGNHPWRGVSNRPDSCDFGPGIPCPSSTCEHSLDRRDGDDNTVLLAQHDNERLRAALSNIRHKRREMEMGDLSADEAVWEVDAIARAALEDHFANGGKMIELPPAPSGWRPDALVTAANAIIDFYNGPAEAKRPDIFQRLMQRLANALPPAPGDANA